MTPKKTTTPRETLESKLGKEQARKLIENINRGIDEKKADLKSHIDRVMTDLNITDPEITAMSATISKKVQPL